MKIHEYQAKAILAQYGVPVPRGRGRVHASTRPRRRPSELGGSVVVKAQIHAGGRGKGGGVKLAQDADEARQTARADARHDAGDAPDGARGPLVQRLLVEETLPIERELYLGIVLDRAQAQAGVHGVGGGRHGDRGGRGEDAGADPEGSVRAGAGADGRFRRASWRSAWACRRPAINGGGAAHDGAGEGVRGHATRRSPRSTRSSSRRTATGRARSTPRSTSTTTRCTGTRT